MVLQNLKGVLPVRSRMSERVGRRFCESCFRIDSMSSSTGVETRRAGRSVLSDACRCKSTGEDTVTQPIAPQQEDNARERRKGYLAQRRPRADELEDDGVRVLFDARRDVAVHHDLAELVAPRSDVVHHHLVRRQLVLDRLARALRSRLQLDAVAQLTDHLHPQFRLVGARTTFHFNLPSSLYANKIQNNDSISRTNRRPVRPFSRPLPIALREREYITKPSAFQFEA